MLHCDQLSPKSDGIRDDQIRTDLPDLLRRHLIQRQRRRDEEFRGKRLVLADPVGVLLVLHLEVIAVAAYKYRARPLDFLPEHLEGKIVNLMSGRCQRLHDPEGRICVPVGRYTEPCNLHNSISNRIGVFPGQRIQYVSGQLCSGGIGRQCSV